MSTEVISKSSSRASLVDPLLSKSTITLPDSRPRQDSVVSNGASSAKSSSSRPGSRTDRSSLDSYESEGAPQAPAIPGFVVASSKRNADFHELFPNVPEMDYLVQGKLNNLLVFYIENYSTFQLELIDRLWVCLAS
jgi:hypothetical protein